MHACSTQKAVVKSYRKIASTKLTYEMCLDSICRYLCCGRRASEENVKITIHEPGEDECSSYTVLDVEELAREKAKHKKNTRQYNSWTTQEISSVSDGGQQTSTPRHNDAPSAKLFFKNTHVNDIA